MIATALQAGFSKSQKELLNLGGNMAEPYGLSSEIKTIMLLESSVGINMHNYKTGCYGLCMININTYMKRHSIKDTPKNQELAFNFLTKFPTVNIREAITEFRYWLKVYKGNRYRAFAAYQGGWKWRKSKRSIEYAKEAVKLNKKFKTAKEME